MNYRNKKKGIKYPKINILTSIVSKYYEDNNLGFGNDSDRAIIARYRVYKAFDDIIYIRPPGFIDFNMNNAVQRLRKELPSIKYLHRQYNEPDGTIYVGNDYGNLCYISDRWSCEFRLKWLIDLVERDEEYKFISDDIGGDWVIVEN